MTDINASQIKRPERLDADHLVSPAVRFEDSVRKGGFGAWTKTAPDATSFCKVSREIGEFLVELDARRDGTVAMRLLAPHSGREVDQKEVSLALIQAAIADAPLPNQAGKRTQANLAAQARLQSGNATIPETAAAAAQKSASNVSKWLKGFLNAPAQAAPTTAADVDAKRVTEVRTEIEALRQQIQVLESTLPSSEQAAKLDAQAAADFAVLRETCQALRYTAAQASTTALDPVFANVLRKDRFVDMQQAREQLVEVVKHADVTRLRGVAGNVAGSLRALNDKLVDEMKGDVGQGVIKRIATLAASQGESAVDAAKVAMNASRSERLNVVRNVSLLELRLSPQPSTATVARLNELLASNEDVKLLPAFMKVIDRLSGGKAPSEIRVFSQDTAYGNDELLLRRDGWHWDVGSSQRSVKDQDLRGTNFEAVQLALEHQVEGMLAAMRSYLAPSTPDIAKASALTVISELGKIADRIDGLKGGLDTLRTEIAKDVIFDMQKHADDVAQALVTAGFEPTVADAQTYIQNGDALRAQFAELMTNAGAVADANGAHEVLSQPRLFEEKISGWFDQAQQFANADYARVNFGNIASYIDTVSSALIAANVTPNARKYVRDLETAETARKAVFEPLAAGMSNNGFAIADVASDERTGLERAIAAAKTAIDGAPQASTMTAPQPAPAPTSVAPAAPAAPVAEVPEVARLRGEIALDVVFDMAKYRAAAESALVVARKTANADAAVTLIDRGESLRWDFAKMFVDTGVATDNNHAHELLATAAQANEAILGSLTAAGYTKEAERVRQELPEFARYLSTVVSALIATKATDNAKAYVAAGGM
ncbi:MAG: hypothetical protein ACAI38_19655 [Myxococcota bacterium]